MTGAFSGRTGVRLDVVALFPNASCCHGVFGDRGTHCGLAFVREGAKLRAILAPHQPVIALAGHGGRGPIESWDDAAAVAEDRACTPVRTNGRMRPESSFWNGSQ